MDQFIQHAVETYGYLGIFLLMVAESACIPIPSEVTMLLGGAVAAGAIVGAEHHLNFLMVGLMGVAGNLVGSWIAYAVGRAGGRPLVERWGRFIFLREHELDRAEAWWAKRGEIAVFVSRLLPVIRTFISLPAGIGEMPLGRFTLYTVLGCLPWTFALAGAGYGIGASWNSVYRYFKPITVVIAVLAVAGIVWWVLRRRREAARAAA